MQIHSLDVNADRPKYIVMSRDQHAGQSHSTKNDNNSSEGRRVQISGNNPNGSKF
jgi:hypothetical protein